jgi:16S rRNA (guanine527-N7)-methyltransferase
VQQQLVDSEPDLSAARIGAHARELGVELSAAQCGQLQRFAQLLLRWNRVHNLTAITRPDEVLSHHLLDSLSIAPLLPADPPLRVLDAGAGAGLPGIVLAIARPAHRFTLVDAVAKKCAFMTQARLALGLANVEVVHARLEQLGAPARAASASDAQPDGAHFDIVVARALASLSELVALTRGLLAPGARWIAMKGRLPEDELRQLPAGVTVIQATALRVPLLQEARHAVVLQPTAH